MAVIHVLLLLLRALAVGGVGYWVIAIALRRWWRLIGLALGIDRLDTLWRLGYDVLLSIRLIQVVGARRDEEQRAAQPDFLGERRQFAHADTTRRFDDHVARALWAIPVAPGVEVVLPVPADPRMTAGNAIDHITGTVLRAWAPAIAMPVGATLPVIIAGATVATTGARRGATALPVRVLVIGLTRVVIVVTLTRLLGLAHFVGTTLDRQTLLLYRLLLALLLFLQLVLLLLLLLHLLLTLLFLHLVLLFLLLMLLLLHLLLALLLLLLVLLLLLLLLHLLLALLFLLLVLLLLHLLLALLLLLLMLLLLHLLLALLVLLLVLLHLLLLLMLLLLLVLLMLLMLLLLFTLALVTLAFSQRLGADTQTQQTNTCKTPDARFHAFLTVVQMPID
ncbi:MAG: hypothetical protein JWQ69_3584 [Pseudomonas sp.]|nr:hypothetical protein [Pseudomonas sp.]